MSKEKIKPLSKLGALARTLARKLGRSRVKSDRLSREMYAFDSSNYMAVPDLVVFPEDAEETSFVIRAAAQRGIPVMPRGAGTCLSGGGVPIRGGISLSMARMDRILDIDALSRTALVEPGVVNQELQDAVTPLGLMFPPDPASLKVSTIGGNVAECAGGIRGARYGVTKNYVMGLEVVMADGQIVTTGKLSREETLGPDLTGIFNGSEGCFGIITKVLLSLTPAPLSTRTALAAFADINDAALAVSGIIGRGIIPTALELMDHTMLNAVDDYAHIGFPEGAEAVLLLEVDGFDLELDRQLELMVRICRENGAQSVEKAETAAERDALWLARRSGNGALGRIKPAYMVHDVTVPRNQVAPLLNRIRGIGEKYDVIIAQMAHAGDGNAHPHLLFSPDEPGIQKKLHDATAEIFDAALSLGGTLSGEHGVGLEKMPFMGMQFSAGDLGFMAQMKAGLDPDNRLNAGKVLPDGETAATYPEPVPCRIKMDASRSAEGILEFIPDNMTIKVTGDTPLSMVQEAAATINAWLPLETEDFGDRTMADLVYCGARGRAALAFGSLKEYIFGLEFTTTFGQRVRTGGRTAKNVAGFDFTRMLWRSMGRLGRVENITLKLAPLPEARRLVTCSFGCLNDVLSAARRVMKAPLALCTLMAQREPSGCWTLAAELSGSDGLLDVQGAALASLLMGDRMAGGAQIHDPDTPFWRERADRNREVSRLLLEGAGIRSAMFAYLSSRAAFLDMMPADRIELDFGSPGMRIAGQPGQSPLQKLLLENDGFYVKRGGDVPQSLLFDRVSGILKGGSVWRS